MGTTELIKDTLSHLKGELAAQEALRHEANVAILKAASEAAGKAAERFAKARIALNRLAWNF